MVLEVIQKNPIFLGGVQQTPLFLKGLGQIGGPILNRIFGGTLRSPALPRLPKTFGPGALPKASGGIRTVSQLGRTRAGINLSGRQITILGTGALATGTAAILTQAGPSGSSAIETFTKGATEIAEDLGPSFGNVTEFLKENGPIIALAIGGIVLIGLIK